MRPEETCEVVVVGGGSSALEAAIAARHAGAARVIMLEKAPESESGGNAQFSHVGFRFVHSGKAEVVETFLPDLDPETRRRMILEAYTPDEFMADLMRVTEKRIDPVLAHTLVDGSNEAVRWLRDVGVSWELERAVTVGDDQYYEAGKNIHPIGGGPGLLRQLRAIALAAGVEIRYESRVMAIHGNDKHVDGVRISAPDGEYDLMAPAVIACSGGFQASAEMRARYLGANTDMFKVRGSKHNTGEVLQMLIGLGAKTAGHWQGAHMSPIDAEAPAFETPVRPDGRGNAMNRYDYTNGITVNARGERFMDEGESFHSYTYAKTGRAVAAQPDGVAFQLYDEQGVRLFRHGRDYPATTFEAPTIAELAKKIGIIPAVLEQTIANFNAACRSEVEFQPGILDGKSTTDITPPKSNWAVPLNLPPYRALPIAGGVTFSFGGVQIDPAGRVLNTGNQPIRGLFASGDVVGLFFHNYPSCTGQTRNVVFSRSAGRLAAGMLTAS
jgi:tricarballylate dehydrogenase